MAFPSTGLPLDYKLSFLGDFLLEYRTSVCGRYFPLQMPITLYSEDFFYLLITKKFGVPKN